MILALLLIGCVCATAGLILGWALGANSYTDGYEQGYDDAVYSGETFRGL